MKYICQESSTNVKFAMNSLPARRVFIHTGKHTQRYKNIGYADFWLKKNITILFIGVLLSYWGSIWEEGTFGNESS